MADSFTWFEKFGEVCSKLSDEDRKEFVYAIAMYGMYGEEVELPYPLDALFASVKDDVDNSKSARKSGSKGGRPKVSDNAKRGVSEAQKRGVSDNAKRGVSEESEKPETQYNTNQTNTSQSKREGTKQSFVPPTREECVAYGDSIGMPKSESEKFHAYSQARGWVLSGGLRMGDWRSAMDSWKLRGPQFPASDAPKPIPKPVNAVNPDEELERLEREYREKFGEEP